MLSVLCLTATLASQTRPSDQPQARQVADSFMSDLVSNRIANAIAKYETARYKNSIDARAVQGMIRLCGRPLAIKLLNNGEPEVGSDRLANDRSQTRLTFSYKATRTTKNPQCGKTKCLFHVDVQPSKDGYLLTGFGCTP